MSNLEHLMENALCLQHEVHSVDGWEDNKQKFKEADYNIEMAKQEQVSLDKVWTMASYVTLVWCKSLEWELQDVKEMLSKVKGEINHDSIS